MTQTVEIAGRRYTYTPEHAKAGKAFDTLGSLYNSRGQFAGFVMVIKRADLPRAGRKTAMGSPFQRVPAAVLADVLDELRYEEAGGSTYGRPLCDHEGRWLTDVTQPDGDNFVTYGVPAECFAFYGITR